MNEIQSLKLDLKPEASDVDNHMDVPSEGCNLNDQPVNKQWMKRPGVPINFTKVAPEVKRRRRNYQAKKLLAPKNPLMILNELKPGLIYKFDEKHAEAEKPAQPVFTATVEVDGQSFSGLGSSKKVAQQEAAEAALRGLYFDRLLEQLVRKEDNDVEMKDSNQSPDNQAENVSVVPEDDTPWGGLASLAMYKMVALWQSPGSQSAPIMPCASNISMNCAVPAIGDLKTKIPANASEIDPVMLLNQISPNSKFSESSRDVRNGAAVFTMTVDFNGSSYCGSATKKKMAKKLCARSALKSLGVQYADDEGL